MNAMTSRRHVYAFAAALAAMAPCEVFGAGPVGGSPGVATADEPPSMAPSADSETGAEAEARQHFKTAQQLYEDGDLEQALIELQRAYDLHPSFRVLYNIGHVASTTRDYVRSLRAYERYLAEGGDKIPKDRRDEVQHRLQSLRARIAHVRISTNVAGASVSVDDESIGTSPFAEPVMINGGRRRITVSKEGYVSETKSVVASTGDVLQVDFTLIESRPSGADAAAPSQPDRTPSRFTAYSWMGVATAGASLAAAGIVGVLAANASADLSRMTFASGAPSKEFQDQQSKVHSLTAASLVLLGTGVVIGGTTLFLTLTRDPSSPAASGSKAANASSIVVLGGDL